MLLNQTSNLASFYTWSGISGLSLYAFVKQIPSSKIDFDLTCIKLDPYISNVCPSLSAAAAAIAIIEFNHSSFPS